VSEVSPRTSRGHVSGAWLLLALLCLGIAGLPLGYALWRIIQGLWTSGVREVHAENALLAGLEPVLLLKTLGSGLLIGALATLLAWPCAWFVRRRGRGVMALLLVPLMLPSSLAYAGWGLLRAPGTLLGDSIERAAPSGWSELPLVVGKVLAFGGMALWSYPIALIVLAPAVRRIDASVLDAIELETTSAWSRRAIVAQLCAPTALVAVVLVALIMIGSPVPLHLAQVDTYATRVWLALDRMPESQQWAAWISAWPVVVTAAAGGWFAAGMVADADAGAMPGPSTREQRLWWRRAVPTIIVWSLATVVPTMMFAWSVRERGAYANVVRVNSDAMARSLAAGAGTAVVLALVCAVVWAVASGGPASQRFARFAVRLLAVMGLSPGVLVGSWVAGAWTWLAPQVDGGVGLVGWMHAVRARAAAPLLGIGLVALVLSLNEIEASIMVAPPGFDTLARRLLDYLHFSRMEELSSASVLLACVGVLAGGTALVLMRRDR